MMIAQTSLKCRWVFKTKFPVCNNQIYARTTSFDLIKLNKLWDCINAFNKESLGSQVRKQKFFRAGEFSWN